MKVQNAFKDFKNLKVLIVGDVMIDSYLWGKVNRISPEAPVPILSVEKREKRLGGAANVALNVKAMGATPILCSVIGDDQDGRDFLDLLQKSEMPIEGIVSSRERPTTIKHRIIAKKQHVLRVDSESEKDLSKSENMDLIHKFNQLVKNVDVVIFQDYDKGVLHENNISQLIEICNKQGVPSTVDPKKKNFSRYRNVTLFKPNLSELKAGLKIDLEEVNNASLNEAVKQLREHLPHQKTLLTLSEYGAAYAEQGLFLHTPAHKRKIIDVSGAGDTVISIISLCIALDLDAKFNLALSNLAGGLVCEHVGVVPIDKNTLLDEAIRLKLK